MEQNDIDRIIEMAWEDRTPFVAINRFVNLSASEVLISQGLDAYFVSNAIGRLPYAKP